MSNGSTIDIDVSHVSKRYWLPRSSGAHPPGWPRRVWSQLWPATDPFWALDDVTFAVERGAALGIIGPNGAGKSTLLKLLSEITSPTSGEIRLYGRLSALIEVGSGFHPELTGRQNVFLSGSILGMRRAEIVSKLDQIIDFAGIGDFIDAPVKWYSSGMYVRLGFAIAAHLDPQILLVDEAMAVGDEEFQHKCYDRIAALRDAGKTIVFISHDLQGVERLCDRVILMQRGRIAMDGHASTVVSAYRRSVAAGADQPDAASLGQAVALTRVTCHGPPGGGPVATGYPLTVRVAYQAREAIRDVVVDVWYCTEGGRVVQCEQVADVADDSLPATPGAGEVEFQNAALGLQPGTYTVIARARRKNGAVLHALDAAAPLVVEAGLSNAGQFFMPYTRQVRSGPLSDSTPWPQPAAPLVSVVIPCFNQAKYLTGTLGSVLTQDWPSMECIVVDDGSTDDTAAVAASLGATRVVRQINQGLSRARNAGLAAATGEYVLFLDADDELLPDAVRSGVAALVKHRGADAVGRRCQLMDGGGRSLQTTAPVIASADLYTELLGTNFVWTPGAAMFRRSAIESLGGFPTDYPAAGDYAVLLALARRGRLMFDPRDVVRYRKHANNMSGDAMLMLRAVLGALARERPYMSPPHVRALRAGLRRWRLFYGEQLTVDLRREWRALRRPALLMRGALFLVRHCPRQTAVHFFRKLSRIARNLPAVELDPPVTG